MVHEHDKDRAREKRHARVRARVDGRAERPRLCVYRSLSHLYVQAIDDLLFLHRRRAGLVGRERHPDYFERLADERFMRAATAAMFGQGLASPVVLRVNDSPAAGRLVLRGNRSVFLSFSGIEPAWWHLSPGTTLISEIMKAAIARGDSLVNLSLYPEEGKLRWSEALELHNDFIVVAPRRRSRLAFSLYWQIRSMRRSWPAQA